MRNGWTTIDDSGDKLRLAMVSIRWSNLKVVLFLFFFFSFFSSVGPRKFVKISSHLLSHKCIL